MATKPCWFVAFLPGVWGMVGGMIQVYGHRIFMDNNAFNDPFDDAALLARSEIVPTAVHILGLRDDFLAGKVLDSQEVGLALESWDFVSKCLGAGLQGPYRSPNPVELMTPSRYSL